MSYTYKYGSYMSTSGASNFIRPYIYYQITATAEQTTISWYAGCNVKSNYTTNAKITMKTSCTNQSDRSATVDNKGWGGGSHSMISGTYTWTRGTANASKTLTAKMSTNVDSSSVSLTFTISARGKVTITFNTGGGSEVTSQSVFYNTSTALTSAIPTKTNYSFEGWDTSDTAQTVVYLPSSSVKITANLSLYAVWKSAYTRPFIIDEARAYRVANNASGKNPTIVNEGTRAYFTFTTDKGNNISNYLTSYQYYVNGTASSLSSSMLVDTSSLTENVYYGYIGVSGSFNKDFSYDISVEITLTDVNNETHIITIGSFISAEVYEIDISEDGQRIAFGHLASDAEAGVTRTDFGVEIYGDIYLTEDVVKVDDFVIEENTDGYWKYRKWYSGRCEAWYTQSIGTKYSFTTRASTSSFYYTCADWVNYYINLPANLFDFVENAFANATSNGYHSLAVAGTTTSTISLRMWFPYSATPTIYTISLYVVGTWA